MQNFKSTFDTKTEGAISNARMTDKVSGIATVDGIKTGMIVVWDYANGDTAVKLPTAATVAADVAYPVYLQQKYVAQATSGDADYTYKANDAIPMLATGVIALKCISGCAAGDPVYLRIKNGNVGYVDNATSADSVLVAGMKFITTAAANALADVRVLK